MLGRERHLVTDRQHLTQHAKQLQLHRVRGVEAALRVRITRAGKHAVERGVAAKQRLIGWRGNAVLKHTILRGQINHQRRKGAANGVNVRLNRRTIACHLRRLEAARAVDIAKRADAGNRTQVNQLHLVLGDNHVVRLQVVVHHPATVQIPQRRQHLQHVGNRHIRLQRLRAPAA